MPLPYTPEQRVRLNEITERINGARRAVRDSRFDQRSADLTLKLARFNRDARDAAGRATTALERVEVLNRDGQHDGP